MLVLTRKSQESIAIGGDIKVVILRIDKDQVRLGIQAPPSVSVYRQEIFEDIQRENRKAVASTPQELRSIRAIFRQGGK